jgi:hypothetical protein
MDGGNKKVQVVLDDNSDVDVVRGGINIKVQFNASGGVDVHSNVPVTLHPAANDSSKPKTGAPPEIGAVALAGDHEGEIYGGVWPKRYGGDDKPIWFLAAPKSMDHFNAASWATGQGGSLPTRKQGDYLTTLKGKGGAFTEIFNRGTSYLAGYVWLAEPNPGNRDYAWCQRLSGGVQLNYYLRSYELPVLSVRR